ncbi:hypothetical protein BH23GEM8_BH23GEM8_06340 [soil metagenome]
MHGSGRQGAAIQLRLATKLTRLRHRAGTAGSLPRTRSTCPSRDRILHISDSPARSNPPVKSASGGPGSGAILPLVLLVFPVTPCRPRARASLTSKRFAYAARDTGGYSPKERRNTRSTRGQKAQGGLEGCGGSGDPHHGPIEPTRGAPCASCASCASCVPAVAPWVHKNGPRRRAGGGSHLSQSPSVRIRPPDRRGSPS